MTQSEPSQSNLPETQPTQGSDVYSAGERKWMEWGQRARGVMLAPLLKSLTLLRISPDQVTFVAGLLGLAFLPLWLTQRFEYAFVALLTHVLLDGIDGPLARYQQRASARGSFTDTFADQVVVTAVTMAWMIGSPNGWHVGLGAAYIFLYTLLVAMAMVRNALKIPYSWLVRPRFFVYLALLSDYVLGNSSWILTLAAMSLCTILIGLKVLSGFLALRNRIPGPDPGPDASE